MSDYRKPDAYGPPQFKDKALDECERLRAEIDELKTQVYYSKHVIDLATKHRDVAEQGQREAAVALKSLRTENERLTQLAFCTGDERLRAEIERLREAWETYEINGDIQAARAAFKGNG
jgi:uncharacterized coiled-coil DUF342 family protein